MAVPWAVPVKVRVQLPLDRMQLTEAGLRELLVLKLTVPVGVVEPEVAVLVTVAVHDDPWFTTIGVAQFNTVEVPCSPGVMDVIPLLPL